MLQHTRVRLVLRGVAEPKRIVSRRACKRTSCATPTPSFANVEGVDPEVAWWLEALLIQVQQSCTDGKARRPRGGPSPNPAGRGGVRGRGRGAGAAAGRGHRRRSIAWPSGRAGNNRKRSLGDELNGSTDMCAVCGGEATDLACSTGAACGKRFHRQCLDPPPDPDVQGWMCPDCDADTCVVCGGAGELLLCDQCPRAWHTHCSQPPLDAVPEGDWTCAVCRGELSESDLLSCPSATALPCNVCGIAGDDMLVCAVSVSRRHRRPQATRLPVRGPLPALHKPRPPSAGRAAQRSSIAFASTRLPRKGWWAGCAPTATRTRARSAAGPESFCYATTARARGICTARSPCWTRFPRARGHAQRAAARRAPSLWPFQYPPPRLQPCRWSALALASVTSVAYLQSLSLSASN